MTIRETTLTPALAAQVGSERIGVDELGRAVFVDANGKWAVMPGALRSWIESAGLADAFKPLSEGT